MGLVDDIARTYIQGGQQQAEAQRQTGQLYGAAVSKIGELAAGIPQQLQEQKRLDLQTQVTQAQLANIKRLQASQDAATQYVAGLKKNADGTYDTGDVLSGLAAKGVLPEDQERTATLLDRMNGITTAANKAQIEHLADLSDMLLEGHKDNEPITPESVQLGFAAAKAVPALGITDADQQRLTQALASGVDPETLLKGIRSQGSKYQSLRAEMMKPVLKKPEEEVLIPGTGQVVAPGTPAVPKTRAEIAMAAAGGDPSAALGLMSSQGATKSLQTKSVLLDGKPAEVVFDPGTGNWLGPQGDPIAATRIRPMPPAATGNAEQEQANAKTVASGIIAGDTAPSILEGTRGTAQGMALMAEIKRQGGNSDQILRNWMGTKNAIRSLNSAQQIRLAETINKASASLDRVEQLNNEWAQAAPRFGIKILNHANLKAAQNGAYGPEAASIAQRLEGQIADVTGEIGQAIMGGNSPTDHGLELAGKNISGDWSQQVLADSIKQVRYNLNLAQQARNDLLGQVGSTSTQVQTPTPSKDPLGIR